MFWVTDSLLIMKCFYIFWTEYWHLFWQSWLSVFIVIILEKGKTVWNATLGWVPAEIITCYLPLIPLQHCSLGCSVAVVFKLLFTAAQQKPLFLSEMDMFVRWLTVFVYHYVNKVLEFQNCSGLHSTGRPCIFLSWEETGVNSSTFIEAIQVFYSLAVVTFSKLKTCDPAFCLNVLRSADGSQCHWPRTGNTLWSENWFILFTQKYQYLSHPCLVWLTHEMKSSYHTNKKVFWKVVILTLTSIL